MKLQWLWLWLWPLVCTAVDVEQVVEAVEAKQREILAVFGEAGTVSTDDFSGADFFSEQARSKIVERVLRSVITGGDFVISIGGMSDVAGHGNLFRESYPVVFEAAVKEAFAAAGVAFTVRNMAMGGVPSYPNSLCMEDNFGADADVVVWDFRMVERDEIKGELFVRQAMLMPRAPLVCFKRNMAYLRKLHYAHQGAALHVLDEMQTYNLLQKRQSPGVTSDKFCQTECECPGQVRWHAGWKMQRYRGLHLAMFYLGLLRDAVAIQYPALSASDRDPSSPRWRLSRRRPSELPVPISEHVKPAFASRIFRCATSWSPRVGPNLHELVDPQLGLNGWRIQHPSKRAAEHTIRGQRDCGYKDAKEGLVGDQSSHWIFFNLPEVADEGVVAFCGDFASKDFADYALIVLNQEEVMDKLDVWLESKTLGISAACFATTHNVLPGKNVLGFRITSGSQAISLTHVLWTPAASTPTSRP